MYRRTAASRLLLILVAAATVASALGPYGGERPEVFTVAGPDVGLTPRESLGFSVALHELATVQWQIGDFITASGFVSRAFRRRRAATAAALVASHAR